MRRHDGGEEFARKFMPEMVQEILQSAADAPVVIGRAEDIYIGSIDARFQAWEYVGAVSRLRVVERQRLLQQVEDIDAGPPRRQLPGDMLNDRPRDGVLFQTPHHRQNV